MTLNAATTETLGVLRVHPMTIRFVLKSNHLISMSTHSLLVSQRQDVETCSNNVEEGRIQMIKVTRDKLLVK